MILYQTQVRAFVSKPDYHRHGPEFTTKLRNLGTLTNGHVFVAVSSMRAAGRGLFAGIDFKEGTFVCLFGGEVRW